MTLAVRTPDGTDLGSIELSDGKLVPTGGAAAGLARTALLKAGNAQAAYDLLNGYDNGYVLVGEPAEAALSAGPYDTISGQLDLAAIHGKHIPGTAYTFRHGWIPLIGQQLNDVYPQWKIDRDKEKVTKEARRADVTGKGHIRAAREAVITVSGQRKLTRTERAIARERSTAPEEAEPRIAPAPSSAARESASAFQSLLPPLPPPRPGPASIGALHDQLAPPPTTIGSLHDQLTAGDPALGSLAGPGVSEDTLKKYIDATVAAKVAELAGQITPQQSQDTRDALAKMHAQQQKLIAITRKMHASDSTDQDADLQKHTVANTLFSFAGVAVAMGSLAFGLGPVVAALVAGIVPLTNVIHDYARNLS